MIVESILEGVLSKYLDKWFYGITKDNMKAEVLKGKFVISNIGLRDSIFIGTNMPYDLRHSYVEKI